MKVKSIKINNDIYIRALDKNKFRMFRKAKNTVIGDMYVNYRNDLYIADLEIVKSERRKGYGKLFLDFAKNLSKKHGLNGRLRVLAGIKISDTSNPSHIFYRKYGFTTDNKQVLNAIDRGIKTGSQLDYMLVPPVYMYYQP